MLFAICGDLGAGKTLLLTDILYKAFNSGIPVYSNYSLSFKHKQINSLEELFNYEKGIVGLDEFWTWLDSRASIKKKSIYRTRLVLQSRKKLFHIFYTTQSFYQIDLRVRNVTSLFFLPLVQLKLNVLGNLHLLTKIKVYDRGFNLLKVIKADLGKSASLYDTNEIIEDIEGYS